MLKPEEKEFLEILPSTSELLKVLGEYIIKRGEIEFKNPELKDGFKLLQTHPEKVTELIEKIHEKDKELGKQLMLLLVDIGTMNVKLQNLEILGAEDKISLGKYLINISKRVRKVESRTKILLKKRKR